MNNDMVIELTDTHLQFIKLPDTYDEDVREEQSYILSKHGWTVHSCACPQVNFVDLGLFLPGYAKFQDHIICQFPKNPVTYRIVFSLLQEVCEKFGYNLINTKYERTVTL